MKHGDLPDNRSYVGVNFKGVIWGDHNIYINRFLGEFLSHILFKCAIQCYFVKLQCHAVIVLAVQF